MNDSIEEIWKNGFIEEDALVAPKINDLYNQKSKNIVDKFEWLFKWNLIGLAAFSCFALVALSLFGLPYLGVFVAGMLMSLFVRGRKEQASLQLLDKNVSSYQYLKSFELWLKDLMEGYAKLYSLLYPALALAIIIQCRFTELGQVAINGFIAQYPNTTLILATPLSFVLVTLIIAVALYFFSGPIYRLDFNSLYGRSMTKLEDLIRDMEELRK